jgi:hypothetical protein
MQISVILLKFFCEHFKYFYIRETEEAVVPTKIYIRFLDDGCHSATFRFVNSIFSLEKKVPLMKILIKIK